MIENDRFIAATPLSGEERVEERQDRAIRPRMLADYIGQPIVREQMEIFIGAARARGEALDHTLVFGPPGLGKTTLANIIAEEMGVQIKSTSGPVMEKAGALFNVYYPPAGHALGAEDANVSTAWPPEIKGDAIHK